jgi:hypothetical protein
VRRHVMDHRATAGRTAGALAITFALIGCGGGATASTAVQPETSVDAAESVAATAAPATASSAGETAAPAPSADSASGEMNTAVVIIGDDRYEFTGVRCDIFAPRYIQAGTYGEDPELVIVLPPEGWESQGDTYGPPSVHVAIGDPFAGGVEWVAGDDGNWFGAGRPDGASQIDSYTVPDGRPVTATGTATFSDRVALQQGGAAEPRTGSFEVTCP